jgi:nascent polypeptide-associated complex subunit alpha
MMPGMDPRQMAMMMKRMGVEMAELDDVEEVVVRTKAVEYRFRKAQVSVIRAQGSETWQIVGKPERVARGAASPAPPTPTQPPIAPMSPNPSTASAPSATSAVRSAPSAVAVSPDDVQLVMEQTGRGEKDARAALEATGGDLAEAILRLEKK